MTTLELILSKVVVSPNGCLLWRGARISTGYGCVAIRRRTALVHRVLYEIFVGPIPDGLVIDHLCRTPLCCNPAHLEIVTNQENARRGLKGILTTHCPHGHPYDAENTYVDAKGWRECRTCIRERGRASYARDPEPQKARSRAYYRRNRERILARERELRAARKDAAA